MKVSVIVPVYNTEKYLEKCLNSIINQTIGFNNIELIIINDGSIDNSEKIIKKFLKKYDDIVYVKQCNGGLSNARNNGMKLAHGEYISFIDSDDYITNDYYEKLLKNNNNYDIISCNLIFKYDNYEVKKNFHIYDNVVKNFLIMNAGACNLIFKRNFLIKNKFSFTEGIIHEDLAAVPPLAIMDAKIKYIDDYLYYYVQSNNSIVRQNKFNPKKLDIYKALEIFSMTIKNNNKYDEYFEEIEYIYIYNLLYLAGGGFIKYKESIGEIKNIKNILDNNFPNWKKNKYFNQLNFKEKFKIKLLYNEKFFVYKLTKKIENFKKKCWR